MRHRTPHHFGRYTWNPTMVGVEFANPVTFNIIPTIAAVPYEIYNAMA